MLTNKNGLILHMHPLASYCWKVLLALYETGVPFQPRRIDGVPEDDKAFADLWPLSKMPLLQDGERAVPETTIIIEYLQAHRPCTTMLIPADGDAAGEVRLWDRVFDLYVHAPLQKCVSDRLRPEGSKDSAGVADAHKTLDKAYALLDHRMMDREWVAAETFSMADCAAMPPLFYLEAVHPYRTQYPALAAYFDRLLLRPSARRVVSEARPWMQYFPFAEKLDPRFLNADAYNELEELS